MEWGWDGTWGVSSWTSCHMVWTQRAWVGENEVEGDQEQLLVSPTSLSGSLASDTKPLVSLSGMSLHQCPCREDIYTVFDQFWDRWRRLSNGNVKTALSCWFFRYFWTMVVSVKVFSNYIVECVIMPFPWFQNNRMMEKFLKWRGNLSLVMRPR